MQGFVLLLIVILQFLAPTAWGKMGFYKTTEVPPIIAQASESVFQIVTPQSDTYTVYDRADYATPQFLEKIADLKSKKMELQWGQMNFCVSNSLPVCLVYDDIAISTAFVVFDSYHLATNRHADQNLLINLRTELKKRGYSDSEVFEVFKNYPIPMKIAKNLKPIENLGTKKLQYARWFDVMPAFFSGHSGIDYLASDIILISVQEPVGTPLKIAQVRPVPGDRIYVPGFHGRTTNRLPDHKVPDSPGLSELSVTTGIVSTTDHGFSRIETLGSVVRQTRLDIQNDLTVGAQNLKVKWSRVIFNDADSEHGGSGSPYLNVLGEVVGIHSTGLLEYRGTNPSLTVSVGVAWPWQELPRQDFELLNF